MHGSFIRKLARPLPALLVVTALGVGAVWAGSVSWFAGGVVVLFAAGWSSLMVSVARRDPANESAAAASELAEKRSALVAAASHEIRNPLTMIAAAAELFDDQNLTESQQQFVRVFRQQSRQGISIADDLLIQSRIDAGRFSIHPIPTDVVALVREVIEAMRSVADQRFQTLIVDVPQYMPEARVDPRALRQALSNLLMNAVRHTAEGRTIVTRVRDNESAVMIAVIDDGNGMSKEERRRLFAPFESGDLLGDGTGLGLNITRQLVTAHHGRILVDTRLSEGTAIVITLPKEKR